jgi:hypothetical protein
MKPTARDASEPRSHWSFVGNHDAQVGSARNRSFSEIPLAAWVSGSPLVFYVLENHAES